MIQLRTLVRPALVVLACLFVGWPMMAVTIDQVFAQMSPATALAWNPGSADANVSLANHLLQAKPMVPPFPAIRVHAERALARQPVDPEAARLLGLVAAGTNEPVRADSLIVYAEAMSRRDLPTQLFLIERNVTKGNITGALIHYDRAMRTTPSSWTTLFPVLDSAAQVPAIWQPLTSLLARHPPWARPFVEQFVPQAGSVDALVAIARQMGLSHHPSPDFALLQAIERRLIDLHAFRAAALLYDHAHGLPEAGGTLLRDGGFEQAGGWDPFDWNLVDEPDLSAERRSSPAGHGQALFLMASNGRGGDVAAQVVILPPGAYRVSARVGDVGGDKLAFPQLIVRCAVDGRDLFHQVFPPAPADGRLWQAGFVVPADCPAERIAIRARSPLDSQDATPWVDDLVLQPEGGL